VTHGPLSRSRLSGPCVVKPPAGHTRASEHEKDFLHEKTLEVLEKVGVAYRSTSATG